MSDDRRVLISGGGPVGLFCALLLGRAGVPVRLFDANPCLQEDPRAATTHPATLEIMGAAGLAEEMERVGLVAPIFQFWDRPAQRLLHDHALAAAEIRDVLGAPSSVRSVYTTSATGVLTVVDTWVYGQHTLTITNGILTGLTRVGP